MLNFFKSKPTVERENDDPRWGLDFIKLWRKDLNAGLNSLNKAVDQMHSEIDNVFHNKQSTTHMYTYNVSGEAWITVSPWPPEDGDDANKKISLRQSDIKRVETKGNKAVIYYDDGYEIKTLLVDHTHKAVMNAMTGKEGGAG